MALVESFSPDELPLYDLDSSDWGADLQSLGRELFAATYQGLRRLTGGSIVVYRNDDLHALGMHKAVSHELPPTGTAELDLDAQTVQWLWQMGDNNPFVARPPEHMPKKQLGMRRLTTISMSRYADAAAEIVDTLAAEASKHGEIDFVAEFTNPLLVRFWGRVLGLRPEEAERLIHFVDDFMLSFRETPTRDELAKGLLGGAEYMALLTQALAREMRRGNHDVLLELASDHAAMKPVGRPDDPCVFLAAFAVDAFHALGSQIANVVYSLLAAPEAHARVRADQTLVPMAFLEGSRLDPAVIFTAREAVSDFDYQGIAVPAGARLLMLWACGNRDPSSFERPDEYRLERPNRSKQHTFGAGFYVCPGRHIGRLLSEIVLAGLTKPGVEVRLAGEASWTSNAPHHDPLWMPVSIRHL